MSYALETVGQLKQITRDGQPLNAQEIVDELNQLATDKQTLKDKRDQARALVNDAQNRLEDV